MSLHQLFYPGNVNDILRTTKLTALTESSKLDDFTLNVLRGKVSDRMTFDEQLGHFVCAIKLLQETDVYETLRKCYKKLVVSLANDLPESERFELLKKVLGEDIDIAIMGDLIWVPLSSATINMIAREEQNNKKNNKIITKIEGLKVGIPPAHLLGLYEQILTKNFFVLAEASRKLSKLEALRIKAACPKTCKLLQELPQKDTRPPAIGLLYKLDWNSPKSASEIIAALRNYKAKEAWEKREIKTFLAMNEGMLERFMLDNLKWFTAARAISEKETGIENENIVGNGSSRKLRVCMKFSSRRDSGRGYLKIHIQKPEDLLILPCIKNLVRRLQERGGSRWEKLALGTIMIHCGLSKKSIVDFYRRFPWFDPQKSEYEINYEINNIKSIPPSCHSDKLQDMTAFCEKEKCNYNIYASLPFPQSLYDKIERKKE